MGACVNNLEKMLSCRHASLLLSRAGEASSGAYLNNARLWASQRLQVKAAVNG